MTEETLPTPAEPETPAKRDTRFQPGEAWKGNSSGRARGTKNRITLQRLLLEEKLREQLEVSAAEILEKAITMAKEGNDKIMRTLLDKLLTTPKNAEDDTGKDTSISVTINDLSGKAPVQVEKGRQTLTINAEPVRVIEHNPNGDLKR